MSEQIRESRQKQESHAAVGHPTHGSNQSLPPVLQQETAARARRQPEALSPSEVQQLQSRMGNQAVQQLLAHSDRSPHRKDAGESATRVQPALHVGPVGDRYEEEADRMAQRVVEMPAQTQGGARPARGVQRHPWHAEEEELQMKPNLQRASEGGFQVDKGIEKRLQQRKNHGRPMPDVLRKDMEGKFGADFTGVRIHTGKDSVQLARDISAKAFTHGQHIHFGADAFQPESKSGRHLLAHELTHVVQQNPKTVQTKRDKNRKHPVLSMQRDAVGDQAVPDVQRIGPERAKTKEKKLAAQYGIPVGKKGKHFDKTILKEIEKTLASLPEGNAAGTFLPEAGIKPDTGSKALASFYDYEHKDITVGSPWWLPSGLHKNMRIGEKTLGIMGPDQAAVKMDALGNKARYPRQEDRDQGGLSIFQGIGGVHQGRKLLPYTIRHEIGHAIDHKIKFTKTRGRLKEFGGWQQHGGDESERGIHDDPKSNSVVKHYMDKVRLKDENLKAPDRFFVWISDMLGAVQSGDRLPADLDQYVTVTSRGNQPISKDAVTKTQWAAEKLEKARNSPWMLNDGGASDLEHNGRVFHLDHYGTWVSYDADARRKHGVSNYQFSSPGEWFAEAYAVYTEPELDVGKRGRDRLNQATKTWMAKNLGSHDGTGGRGDLVQDAVEEHSTSDYSLQELADISPEKMKELNKELREDEAGITEALPPDLVNVLDTS